MSAETSIARTVAVAEMVTRPAEMVTRQNRLTFTDEQRKLIRDSFANGASEKEFAVLMEIASARNLNPFLKQIHFVKRWDSMKKCDVWSTQVGIDGLRAIAERTGRYDGQDEPEFEYDSNGKIKLARVRVYRRDHSRPSVGIAFFSEYVQTKSGGEVNHMWSTKPHIMIAKCAEALAFRKAFPEDTSGLYIAEEFDAEPQRATITPHNDHTVAPDDPALEAIRGALGDGECDVPVDRLAAIMRDVREHVTAENVSAVDKAILSYAPAGTSAHALHRAVRIADLLDQYAAAKTRDDVDAAGKVAASFKFAKGSPERARVEAAHKAALARVTPPDGPSGGGSPKPDAAKPADEGDVEREAIAAESIGDAVASIDPARLAWREYLATCKHPEHVANGVAKHRNDDAYQTISDRDMMQDAIDRMIALDSALSPQLAVNAIREATRRAPKSAKKAVAA